jgi:hypothetical protein
MSGALKRGAVIGRVAPAALVPGGALAVHQLRYWLAFHGMAGAALERQGHSYLHSVVPWIVLLIAVAVGAFLRSLGRAFGGRCSLPRYTLSFAALWLICAACLVLTFVCQEFLEGLFATGHPAGLAGIFGYGGWWSIPASLAVGLVLAAAFQGARWVLSEVAHRRFRAEHRRARQGARRLPLDPPLLRLAPIADGWSGRGPPR